MIPQSADTDPRAEAVLISLIRQSTVSERLARMRSMSQSVAELSRRAIKRANPGKNRTDLTVLYIQHFYGESLARDFQRSIDRVRQ
ncbi:MAG: hypothetical protein JW768_08050 [Chitinispirillaceae bacterium]|nr:hypothetical protein [Chitinispirillaceae bacterium]